MLTRIFESYCYLPRWMRTPLWKMLHSYLNAKDRNTELTFLNYGYAGIDEDDGPLSLKAMDEPNRYSIQLYHHVASGIDVSGKNLAEVGCGRGGGASYITRYLHPRSYVGIDQSVRSTRFCNAALGVDGLSFVVGDAEAIPLPDSSVDAVVNVESSRCYRHMERFLAEVRRILKPGGHLLFADLRDTPLMPLLREQFGRAGFEIDREKNITEHVIKSLDLDHERRAEVIRRHIPRPLAHLFEDIAGVKGSERNQALASGDLEYWSFTLRSAG